VSLLGGVARRSGTSIHSRWVSLGAIFLVLATSYADKQLLPLLLEPIKREFKLSDTMIGFLGGAPFTICFTISSIFLARMADYGNRKTILIASLAVWSMMTGLCGIVPGVALLFVMRMGVGFGEGGAIPPAYALAIANFPVSERGKIFSVFALAGPAGAFLALVGGGYVAQQWGWRAAFIAVSLMSVPVGLLALAVVREPRALEQGRERVAVQTASDDFRDLFRKRSFALLVAGVTTYSLFLFGPAAFMPTYLVRIMGIDLATAGATFGVASTSGAIAGALIAWIAIDRLKARDVRWLFWLPAVAMSLAWPACVVALVTQSIAVFTVMTTLMFVLLSAAVPSIGVAVQQLCGEHRRATATATYIITMNLVGGSLGSLLTGVLSDAFSQRFGATSLRYAMISMTTCLGLAALLFVTGARYVRHDAED